MKNQQFLDKHCCHTDRVHIYNNNHRKRFVYFSTFSKAVTITFCKILKLCTHIKIMSPQLAHEIYARYPHIIVELRPTHANPLNINHQFHFRNYEPAFNFSLNVLTRKISQYMSCNIVNYHTTNISSYRNWHLPASSELNKILSPDLPGK